MDKSWTITLSPLQTRFKGFVPVWFKNDYPVFGNKGQASDMLNIDLTDPNVLSPGPKPSDFTGTQPTTEISTILNFPTSTDPAYSYAAGENIIYKLLSSSFTTSLGYPKTLDKASVTGEDITDIIYYKGNLYGFYNHSGNAGDIFKITGSVIDPDWGSTVPAGAHTLVYAPHYSILAGDDSVYITNGRYVAKMDDDSTLDDIALDFWADAQVSSLTWNNNRVYVAVNRPSNVADTPTSNFNQSGIYRWNGSSTSWEGDPIEVSGRIGALYTKNGTTYVWWQDDVLSSYSGWNTFNFGYIDGGKLVELRKCKGYLPNQNQVCELKGYIAWMSESYIYLYGASSSSSTVDLFQYAKTIHSDAYALANPFGSLIASSYYGGTHYLSRFTGNTKSSSYNTKVYPVTGAGIKGVIDMIQVEFDKLATGARADFTLTYDKGESTKTLESIIYSATDSTTLRKILSENKSIEVEDFKLDISHTNGSEANPVKIRSILIKGHYITNN